MTELYGIERERKGRNEGRDEGRNEERLNSIRNLMHSLSISHEKAMALLMIPKEEQAIYIDTLSKEKQDN